MQQKNKIIQQLHLGRAMLYDPAGDLTPSAFAGLNIYLS
jgi:hypothetical protein